MSIVLDVQNVTKVYKMYKDNLSRLKELFLKRKYHKEFIVNKNISFQLFQGETLGIIGMNGAGKSTILKIIAGVIEPTYGRVIKHGRVTALLELGTGFNDEMSGYENIFLNATLLGMSEKEIQNKLKQIIDFSELGEYINEPIKTYSSGMRMRLAFSIAIFSEPNIFIIDEALSVGDAHFSAKCIRALKEKKKDNMAIIYVSHDLNSLKVLCDRMLFLDKGEIIKEGNPEDVINSYNYLISKMNDQEEKIVSLPEQSSFGTFDIEIIKVEVIGKKSHSNILSSGEEGEIKIFLKSKADLKNMTVGIAIRDKLGQDIFGTNTYYHNLTINFEQDKEYIVSFLMPFNIGTGQYSITAAVHKDETHVQECIHWYDNVAKFEIAGFEGNRFIGLCRLEPQIKFSSLEK